jgi:hypothetical protein
MIKSLKKIGWGGLYFNIIRGAYDKPVVNITWSEEKLNQE